MKKLEMTIVRNAVANREVTDVLTDRQAQTVQELADAGIIRLDRCERVKANMNIVAYRGGTESTVRNAENAEAQSEETETESE
jgi:hypothetical protein